MKRLTPIIRHVTEGGTRYFGRGNPDDLNDYIRNQPWEYEKFATFISEIKDGTGGLVNIQGTNFLPMIFSIDPTPTIDTLDEVRGLTARVAPTTATPLESRGGQILKSKEVKFRGEPITIGRNNVTDERLEEFEDDISSANFRNIQKIRQERIKRLQETGEARIFHFMLWINPETMSVSRPHRDAEVPLVDRIERHPWGPGRGAISCRGKTPGFFVEGIGLTRHNRRKAEAYKNLISLLARYLSNAGQFNNTLGNFNGLETIGSVILTYDGIDYEGTFRSFEISETDESPFVLNYSFDFEYTRRVDFLTDKSDINA